MFDEDFTFQSGYIQIKLSIPIIAIGYTLHSNLVIFKFAKGFKNNELIALHSNLVIFKYACKAGLVVYAERFTFQSGYIQIGTCRHMIEI